MAIPTTRTNEKGRITIDYKTCTDCEICTVVCKDFTLQMKDGKVEIDQNPLFGCIACGQCVAVCPQHCITLEGRLVQMTDFEPLPPKESRTGYDELYNLLVSRRSVRDFKDRAVEPELVEKILKAASTAPMGIPPSDVQVLVLQGSDKVRQFSSDYLKFLSKIKWMFSPFMISLMKPFLSKGDYQLFKVFLKPMINFFMESNSRGEDYVLYGAPLAMYFYSTDYADPADAEIAATYAMITAESLGLGSCMIGSIGPFIKNGAKELKKKYGIYPNNRSGVFIIFGYPKYKYHSSIKRTFGKVIQN